MLNFVIDTSVFTLPIKSENTITEKDNLCLLRDNIESLRKLQGNDSITVSYINETIPKLFKIYNYLPRERQISLRIKDLLGKKPEYLSEISYDEPFLNKWDDFLLYEIYPDEDDKTGKITYKGKVGIFNNIPDRDKFPSEDYNKAANFTTAYNAYPKLPLDFAQIFKKYCGYIADLNLKYNCFDNNFIVLGEASGKLENNSYTINLNKGKNYINSRVSIVGIQKAAALCPPTLEFKDKDLVTACKDAVGKFSEKLVFGGEIKEDNIQANLDPKAGTPEKIYRYLETLYNISDLIIKESINIQKEDIVELLNSYGLLSSPEDEKYEKNKCKKRKFLNKSGKKQIFSIHLKPSSYKYKAMDNDDINYTIGSKYTVRIYLYWDNNENKFVLGWIGHHPPFCRDCDNADCQEYG